MRNANKLHRHLSTTPVSLASAIIISLLIFAPITPCLAEAKKDQGRDKPSSTNYVPLAKVSLSVVVTNCPLATGTNSVVIANDFVSELEIVYSNLVRAEKRLIEARKDADYLLPLESCEFIQYGTDLLMLLRTNSIGAVKIHDKQLRDLFRKGQQQIIIMNSLTGSDSVEKSNTKEADNVEINHTESKTNKQSVTSTTTTYRVTSIHVRNGRITDRFYEQGYDVYVLRFHQTNDLIATNLEYALTGRKIEVFDSSDIARDFFKTVVGTITIAGTETDAEADVFPLLTVYHGKVRHKKVDMALRGRLFYPSNNILTSITDNVAMLKVERSNIIIRDTKLSAVTEDVGKVEAIDRMISLKEVEIARQSQGKPFYESEHFFRTKESFNFSLAYALTDVNKVKYDNSSGQVTAKKEDETPLFVTLNWYPIWKADSLIKNKEDARRTPESFFNPPHLMFGVRTDISSPDPIIGVGVGIRIYNRVRLNVWGGINFTRQERLKEGIAVGDEVAETPTTNKWRDETLWGVSIAWTGEEKK